MSIRTTAPHQGRVRRYDDIASDDGFFEYRFSGENPDQGDNRALRQSWADQTPLIYFYAVVPTVYQAIYPAFVTHRNPQQLSVHLVPGERVGGSTVLPASIDARRYLAVQAKRRLHQAVFREIVLDAYQGRCAVSGLPERRLLQAAHILPDRDERGLPVIGNGIAMTALHHAAYDSNLLGIDPDGGIHLNRELLRLHDGPTLECALKGVHGTRLQQPRALQDLPNRDFLAVRYEQFKAA